MALIHAMFMNNCRDPRTTKQLWDSDLYINEIATFTVYDILESYKLNDIISKAVWSSFNSGIYVMRWLYNIAVTGDKLVMVCIEVFFNALTTCIAMHEAFYKRPAGYNSAGRGAGVSYNR